MHILLLSAICPTFATRLMIWEAVMQPFSTEDMRGPVVRKEAERLAANPEGLK